MGRMTRGRGHDPQVVPAVRGLEARVRVVIMGGRGDEEKCLQPTPRMLSRCLAPYIIVRVDTIICHGVYRSVGQAARVRALCREGDGRDVETDLGICLCDECRIYVGHLERRWRSSRARRT